MAATLLKYPILKVFQRLSTQVASGAKIYTYIAGTTTDKVTYADQALTIANTNPVIADSNGEATIWLGDDTLYKIVINDSNDVLISSTDNVGVDTSDLILIQGGSNLVLNGGFEVASASLGVPENWDLDIISGGAIATDTFNQSSGSRSLKFEGGINGAGSATSSFFPVMADKEVEIQFSIKASAPTVSQSVEVLWFTTLQVPATVSSTSVYNVISTAPNSWTEQVVSAIPGSDVRYARIRINGSITAGTTYYDNIKVAELSPVYYTKGENINSASFLLVNIPGDYHDVFGTTTITSMSVRRVGTIKKLHFNDSLILTHSPPNIVLPNGTNITTQAGDVAEFVEFSQGNWRCTNYTSSPGNPFTGTVTDGDNHTHVSGDGAKLQENSHTPVFSGSSYRIAQTGVTVQHSVSSYTRLSGHLIVVPRTGLYQVSFEMRGDNAIGNCLARFYRNESPSYTGETALGDIQTEGDGIWLKKTQGDINFAAGDVIVMYSNSNTSLGVSVRNFTLESATKLLG